MRNLIVAVVTLWAAFASLPAYAQDAVPSEASHQAELNAALQAASKTGTDGPKDVALIDQAVLKLPAGYFFVPKAEGLRILHALGNAVDDPAFVSSFNGLVLGKHPGDSWIVAIRYIKEGYIKDDDAKNWNADELLTNIREGAEQANQDRARRGFPELQVVGWIEPPSYDAGSHRLVWSLLSQDKQQPDRGPKGVNYNTYALGRDGYFSLNLLTSSERIASDKAVARELLGNVAYNAGKRYEDFSATTDRVAEYGLLALVGGVAVKKLGLLALAGAVVLKFAKLIILGLAALGAGFMKFFRRKPRSDAAGGTA